MSAPVACSLQPGPRDHRENDMTMRVRRASGRIRLAFGFGLALITACAEDASGIPPAGTESCAKEAPKADVQALSCNPDVTLRAAAPYTVPADVTDQYVCFGVDIKLTSKRHVTALAPKVDNTKILHHILLFQSPDAV